MALEIDAVAMTHAIREAHHEALKGATLQQRIEFHREKARHLHEELQTGSGELNGDRES